MWPPGEILFSLGQVEFFVNGASVGTASVHLQGTIKTTSVGGEVQLKWAQATSNAHAVTVKEGSYLRADAIE